MNFIYICVVILITGTATPSGCQNFEKGDTCLLRVLNKNTGMFMETDETVDSIADPGSAQSQAEVLGINVTIPLENLLVNLVRESPIVFAKNTSRKTDAEWVRLCVTVLKNIPNEVVTFTFSEYRTKVRCLVQIDEGTKTNTYYMSSGILDEVTRTVKLENGHLRTVTEVDADNPEMQYRINEVIPNADWGKLLLRELLWLVVSFDPIPMAGAVLTDGMLGIGLIDPKIVNINNLMLQYEKVEHGRFLPVTQIESIFMGI